MIDFSKPVQTRGGKPVRILCTYAYGSYPILGLVDPGKSTESLGRWDKHGSSAYNAYPAHDLVNVKEKITIIGWVCIYKNPFSLVSVYAGRVFPTKEEAIANMDKNYVVAITKIIIETEVGEGLE